MHAILLFWLIAVNLIAVIVTVWDKTAAKAHRRRTPEATLLGIGALGGALAMLITMKAIRHKTKKAKFMIGLPLLILIHAALAVGVWMLTSGGITM